MSEWYKSPYKAGPPVGPEKLPRALYPPDAAPDKTPSPDGDDVLAHKRAVKRAQRWAKDKDFDQLDDSYSNGFAHGTSPNVADSGIAGFQRQEGIEDTGWLGDDTYQAMRRALVPTGPNEGQSIYDSEAIKLLTNYKPPPPVPVYDLDDFRKACVEFCNIGLDHTSGWNYTQSRPVDVSVDPSGKVNSDCSGSVIQITHYGKTKTGLSIQDPSKQGWSGYGNTDINLDDWPTVTGSYLVGDLGHYQGHVVFCMKAGNWDTSDWWSFGSEPPTKRNLSYRSDFRKVVRPEYLK